MGQPKGSVQPQQKRTKNFNEVFLGYSKRVTTEESRRCPQCSDPVCVNACPIGINIPGFIRLLREGNTAGAYEIIREKNVLPSTCGRICSAPCEISCILKEEDAPIGIRTLERYAADFGRPRSSRKDFMVRKGKKVAVIGSGPAGLSASADLACRGYQVKIFESMDQPGGVLRYGIPEFRIPNKNLDIEIDEIKSLGIEIETNCSIGHTKTIQELKEEGFVAVLLTVGAGLPKFMDLDGANLGGVYYAEEFLMRVNRLKLKKNNTPDVNFPLGQNVVIIGSGNTALDCARTVVRLNRNATVIFRRTLEEMKVREAEKKFAQEEGVLFEPSIKPLEILPTQNNFVSGVKCIKMDYADVNSDGVWSIIPVPGSEFVIEADSVIIAVGHNSNSMLAKNNKQIKLSEDGTIKVDADTYMTNAKGIFAAGNVVTNAGAVIDAIASGKQAASRIHHYLIG